MDYKNLLLLAILTNSPHQILGFGGFIKSDNHEVAVTCLNKPNLETVSITECLLECKRQNFLAVFEKDLCYCITEDCLNRSKFESEVHEVYATSEDDYTEKDETTAKSCKSIKTKSPLSASGYYSIKVGNETIKVYCDMETDGGGWMMFAHVNVSRESQYKERNYGKIKSDNISLLHTAFTSGSFALSYEGLRRLYEEVGIREFRVYCHKPSTARTIHFVINSSKIQNFEKSYLVDRAGIGNIISNAYRHLPGDDSNIKSSTINKARHGLYEYVIFVGYKWHVSIYYEDRMECDDYVPTLGFSPTGVWKYYGR